jgi:adenylate kinase
VLDGFPRSLSQASAFGEQVGAPSFAVFLEQTDEQLLHSMEEHLKEFAGDHNLPSPEEMLADYHGLTDPLVEHAESMGKLVRINCSNSVEDQWVEIADHFDNELKPIDLFKAATHQLAVEQESRDESASHVQTAAETAEDTIAEESDKSTHLREKFAHLPVIFVTGGPGSGKGTQCDKIVSEFGFTHLSSGDLLRAKVASGSPDGQELDAMMKAGQLVPLEKVLDLITEAMAEKAATSKGFLIDGYPRAVDQGIQFEEKIKPCSFVIDFDVPDEIMVTRLVERGKTSGRLDDNEETIRSRLQTYREATVPVAAHYDQQGKLVSIDANRDIEEVFADVRAAIYTKLSGAP